MFKSFNVIDKKIKAIEKAKTKLENKIGEVCTGLNDLIEELIKACDHPVGSVYIARNYLNLSSGCITAPWIVCIKCGLAEEGWGCGHDVFAPVQYTDLPQASRDFLKPYVKQERWNEEQYKRKRSELHYQTDLEGNFLHPRDWIRIPKPFHDDWAERKHLLRE